MKEIKGELLGLTIPGSLEACCQIVTERLAEHGCPAPSSATKRKAQLEADLLWRSFQMLRGEPVSPPFLTDALNNSVRAKAAANACSKNYASDKEVVDALRKIADAVSKPAVVRCPNTWLVLIVRYLTGNACNEERLGKIKIRAFFRS